MKIYAMRYVVFDCFDAPEAEFATAEQAKYYVRRNYTKADYEHYEITIRGKITKDDGEVIWVGNLEVNAY